MGSFVHFVVLQHGNTSGDLPSTVTGRIEWSPQSLDSLYKLARYGKGAILHGNGWEMT